MPLLYFISHPEVVLDKSIPVTEWELSSKGLERLEKMLEIQPWLKNIGVIYSSNENKAKIAANRMSEKLGKQVRCLEQLGEMDRSSTGVLDPEEFSEVVDGFFASPAESIRGWERAVDAQERILRAIGLAVKDSPGVDIAVVSHGGVGALLMSHLKKGPITRLDDQPGQGHYFVFDVVNKQLVTGWEPIDT